MTPNTCPLTGSCCWITCALVSVAWLLITSGLLTATWNKVVRTFFNVKALKFTQALLVLATIAALIAPIVALKRGCGKHRCGGNDEMAKESGFERGAHPREIPPIPAMPKRPQPPSGR